MTTLTEAAAAACACIRVRWLETRHPDSTVSGRWVCSTCEREFEPREVAYSRGVQEGTRAQESAILYTVGGTVEGRPTSSINYLQRLRQLVRIEKAAREIADWHAVSGETGFVSAEHLDALADALDGPPVEDPYVVSLRADFARVTAENERLKAEVLAGENALIAKQAELDKSRADYIRDQAEIASLRIDVAELRNQRDQCHLRAQTAELALETERRKTTGGLFIVSQPGSLPWGVFTTLESAQECALRVLRSCLYPNGTLSWESVTMERDPEAKQRDPIVARWRSAEPTEDDCFCIDQMEVDVQGFAEVKPS